MTASHHFVLALVIFALGSCVGSFLNVCVYRIPIGLSVLRPRSRCPRCSTAIWPCDNLPVLGWLILGGRCRHCRAMISSRYPIVELTVGLLFAGPYFVGVALAPGDVWDDAGPSCILAMLLASWVLISLIVVGALLGYDTRPSSGRPTRSCGIRRQDKTLARCELVRNRDAVPVQFDNFVSTTRITQPISRDAPKRLVTSDNVDRQRCTT